MFMVRNWLLYLVFALSLAAVLFLGFYGYEVFVVGDVAKAADLKYHAEQLAYISLVLVTLLALAMAWLIFSSRRLYSEVDKIAQLTQHGHNHVGQYLRRLGRLGGKLAVVFHQLSVLNEMKSLKISAMANLSAFLIDNMDMSLLMLDADGRTVQCSKRFLLVQKTEKRAILGKRLGDLVDGVDFAEIARELGRTRKAVTVPPQKVEGALRYKGHYILYPIFNSADGLVNVLCIMESDVEADALARRTEQITADEGSVSTRLRGFIKDKLGKQ